MFLILLSKKKKHIYLEFLVKNLDQTQKIIVQVWWQKKTVRNQFCPFENQKGKMLCLSSMQAYEKAGGIFLCNEGFVFVSTGALESMQNNISVSMAQHQTREGGVGLSWNVTAPCRLEAEVWLCKREQPGSQCEEVRSSRQRVHDGWIPTRKGHWVKNFFYR